MIPSTIAPKHAPTRLPTGHDFGGGPLGVLRASQHFSNPLNGINKLHQQYGDSYSLTVAGTTMIMLSRPEHLHTVLVEQADAFHKDADYTDPNQGLARFVGKGLLTSDGALWKRQRKLVAPALHARRIAAYAETMTTYSDLMLERWADGQRLDVAREMMHLTIRIVAKSLFDVDMHGEQAEPIFAAMRELQEMQGGISLLPTWLPTPSELRRRKSIRDMDALVYRIIAERKASGTDTGDLLSMLVAARDEDGQPMDDRQIRDEAVTLFLAGHETTANALNWTFMLLAQNPHVEAKLHAEIDQVLGGRLATLSDLDHLPYTEQIIKEAMRLYPPAWTVSRLAIRDVQIGEYFVPANTRVGMHIYHTHRLPDLWDSPDTFDPDRFSPERERQIPRYAYLPFGGGPRVCIGNHFAMMEAKLILATIASRYQLRLAPGQTVGMDARITLNPAGGLPMTVQARQR
jgi:cytochrome P450